MKPADFSYKKHVFVCCNEREQGRECCSFVNGREIFYELKRWVIENGLTQSVWVTKTGCLGFCNDVGATIVIYPDKQWFLKTTMGELGKVKEAIMDSITE